MTSHICFSFLSHDEAYIFLKSLSFIYALIHFTFSIA